MKTFTDCHNLFEASLAAAGPYAFPWGSDTEDEFWLVCAPVWSPVWTERKCYGRNLEESEYVHGLMMHFGCLDAFL